MRVSKNSLVSMCYSMIGDNGEVINESPRTEPFEFFCGAGQLVPGLERQLIGLRAGEHKEFSVAPADAYGEHNATLVKRVARRQLPRTIDVKEGMRIPMRSPEGVELVCRILEVQDEAVVADFNHPLAGQTLNCSVEILDVRSAN